MFLHVEPWRCFGACVGSAIPGLVTKRFPGLLQHRGVTIMDCKFIDT